MTSNGIIDNQSPPCPKLNGYGFDGINGYGNAVRPQSEKIEWNVYGVLDRRLKAVSTGLVASDYS